MKNSEKHFPLFEQYLKKALSAEEMTSFSERLKLDKEFKEDFDSYEQMIIMIRSLKNTENKYLRFRVKQLVEEEIEREQKSNPHILRSNKWLPLSLAAAIALLIMSPFILSELRPKYEIKDDSHSNQGANIKLYAAEALTNALSAEKVQHQPWRNLINIADRELANEEETLINTNAELIEAICLLKQEKLTEALLRLQTIEENISICHQEVNWCLALALILTDHVDEARKHIRKAAMDTQHPFQQEVAKIMNNLPFAISE